MTGSLIELIGRIHDEFDRRGWRDSGNTARSLAIALSNGTSPEDAAVLVSNRFLVQNDCSIFSLEDALLLALRESGKAGRSKVIPPAPGDIPAARNRVDSTPRNRRPAVPPVPPVPRPYIWPIAVRAVIAALIILGSGIALWVGPDAIRWTWLTNHPSRLSLEWGTFFVVVTLAAAIVWWRREAVWLAVLGGIFVVVSLLGH